MAANRRNARKSSGPKTAEGARRLFPRDEADSDNFDHLLESLREDWQPDGTIEEILLEKIAIGHYRLHVVYGYEARMLGRPETFSTRLIELADTQPQSIAS